MRHGDCRGGATQARLRDVRGRCGNQSSPCLSPLGDNVSADLSARDQEYLDRYSGVRAASRDELAALEARSAAQAVAEVAKTLSRQQVATRLGVDVTRVSHQTAERGLYSYRGGGGRPVYPDWQFASDGVIPHLGRVLAAYRAGADPITGEGSWSRRMTS